MAGADARLPTDGGSVDYAVTPSEDLLNIVASEIV